MERLPIRAPTEEETEEMRAMFAINLNAEMLIKDKLLNRPRSAIGSMFDGLETNKCTECGHDVIKPWTTHYGCEVKHD